MMYVDAIVRTSCVPQVENTALYLSDFITLVTSS